MSDKRNNPRRTSERVVNPLHIPVFWKDGGGDRHDGYLFDVGLGGCFLNTSAPADNDQVILLEIPEPPEGIEVLEFTCTVVSQDRRLKGFGLRFESLTDKQKAVLGHFVAKSKTAPDRRDGRRDELSAAE